MLKPFQTTIWASIRMAKEGRSTALNDFTLKYRDPVVGFITRQGYAPEDAEDLAQEVFMIVFRDRLLARAEESRGRFRSFLLGIVKNVVSNAGRVRDAVKRGGGKRGISLDAAIGDDTALGDVLEAPQQDESFDREWAHHLIRLALEELARRNPRHHEALKLHLDGRLAYAEIGTKLGLEPKQVDNLLQQAKFKIAELLRGEIATYCSSGEEFDEEMACLGRHLKPD